MNLSSKQIKGWKISTGLIKYLVLIRDIFSEFCRVPIEDFPKNHGYEHCFEHQHEVIWEKLCSFVIKIAKIWPKKSCGTLIFVPKSHCFGNFCVEQWPGMGSKTVFFRGSSDFARCTPYKNHKKSRFWQLLRLPMRKHRNSCSGTLLHTPASANGHGAQK